MSYDMSNPSNRFMFDAEFRKATFQALREGRGTIEMIDDIERIVEAMHFVLRESDEWHAKERRKKHAERRVKRDARLRKEEEK
jgi:hypothetical protein